MAGLEKISHIQLGCLLFGFISGFEGLFLTEAKILKQDVWIAYLINILLGLGILWIIYYVQRQYPQLNMADICEKLLGKWVGKAMLIVYLLNNLESTAGGFRALTMFYTTIILPNTQSDVLMLICAICSTYAVYVGLGALVRTTVVVIPFFLFAFLFTSLYIFPEIQTNPFLPQLQSKFPDVVLAVAHLFTFTFKQMITFGFLMSRVEHTKKIYSSCSIAVIMAGIYITISSYLTLGSLGLNYIETSTYPFFATIQLVKFGEYLERIETILIGIWTVFTLIYIIVMQYVFTLVVGHVFKITKMRPFVFAIGLLFFAHSCRSFIRTADHFTYGTRIYPISSLLPCIGLPILLAVVTMIKKRRKASL
ncbi:GerAB/ArcD/ProY family transporter [Paenibacillus sp. Soil787]|uniref:GerAB/ArcD/ProY family transporter n=1 Tax=Paenibacillus sp. Soil787 TaxID=1736411 RepID=UPI0006F811EC|nr:endospore germination permease [Paenibacillus sp. Soil787]KRF31638.1 hypothetical protein ASG93_04650 [Paenibacillus sp. Soil787]